MNKLLSICVSLACSALLFACAEEKSDPPTHAEKCLSDKGITEECLIGNWYFNGIEEIVGDLQDNSAGSLELKNNGEYSFSGGAYKIDANGKWTLNGTTLTIDCISGDCDGGGSRSASLTIADSASTLRVRSSGQTAPFSFYNSNSIKNPIEKFTWNE
ncbi:hypothetical protein AGMMS49938_10190 [Fibrobacterales bacterium]|nr:hypothetical protein AGMMS49938_10190 [Fibrobacterales bacterium]